MPDEIVTAAEPIESSPREAIEADDRDVEISEASSRADNQERSDTAKPIDPPIDPPISWNKQQKAHWHGLPRELQEYVQVRERDSHNKISELGQRAKTVERMREIMQPIKQRFGGAEGFDEVESVRSLVNTYQWVEDHPKEAVAHILKYHGLSARDLMDEGAPGSNNAAYEPLLLDAGEKLLNAMEENAELKRQLEAATGQASGYSAAQEEGARYKAELEAMRKAEELRKQDGWKRAEDAKRAASINVKSRGSGRRAGGNWMDTIDDVADRLFDR